MQEGIATLASRFGFEETVQRVRDILRDRGVKLFVEVDHSGEAEAVGLTMPPTRVLIFGSPKAGTPVMLASPGAALDLPLKLLVAEGADGVVHLAWNEAAWLQQRYEVPDAVAGPLAAVQGIAAAAAGSSPG